MKLPALILLLLVVAHGPSAGETPIGTRPPSDYGKGADEIRRGWHFYEDPVQPAPVRPTPAPSAPEKERAAPQAELQRFRALQKEVEDMRAVAIINPSEFNVRRYMELESKVMTNASRFADMAQRIAWANPTLDPSTQGRPVNAAALEVFEREQMDARSATVADLGKDHVIMFFFRSDCAYCHKFAPVLQQFEARYRIRIVPISLDGGALPPFRNFRVDNGTALTLGVAQVPAVYLAQPFSGTITPIGVGVLSESQLVERIVALTKKSERRLGHQPLGGLSPPS